MYTRSGIASINEDRFIYPSRLRNPPHRRHSSPQAPEVPIRPQSLGGDVSRVLREKARLLRGGFSASDITAAEENSRVTGTRTAILKSRRTAPGDSIRRKEFLTSSGS